MCTPLQYQWLVWIYEGMNPYEMCGERREVLFEVTAKRNYLFKFKPSTNNALYLLLMIDKHSVFPKSKPT